MKLKTMSSLEIKEAVEGATVQTEKKGALEHLEFKMEVKVGKAEPGDDGNFRFEGFGSTFGNVDLQDDIVVRGAFVESLKNETPVILWQHFRFEPIGVPEAIFETEEGLKLKVIMPGDDDFVKGRVMPQLRIGSVKSMSIGFIVEEFLIKDDIRFITKARLKEVSLVTFPANKMAVVTDVKSFTVKDIKKMSKRDLEKALRESGIFSKEAALLVVSHFPETGEPIEGEPDEELVKACKEVLGRTERTSEEDDAVIAELKSILKK